MIVIPMAGQSRRFADAGYLKPKYMLPAHGLTMFDHAVLSFKQYFSSQKFIFVFRNVFDTALFVQQRLRALGLPNHRCLLLPLDAPTEGQAHTVFMGLNALSEEEKNSPLTIFNIDTIRPHFTYPDCAATLDGYLEVFEGEGDHWSFIEAEGDRVVRVTEKIRISHLCSTGLYHFKTAALFEKAYRHHAARPLSECEGGERYVAPLYNALVAEGFAIGYHTIARESVVFSGTPDEYKKFLFAKPPALTP